MTVMPPNAFIGALQEPADSDIALALGSAKPVWDQLLADLAAKYGIEDREWKCYSPKAGWSLRLKRGKRTIVWLAVCSGCFRVAFILGDKAVEAAHQSNLSKSVLQIIDAAERYPEGTGVRLHIKRPRDIPAIKKLVEIKLRN